MTLIVCLIGRDAKESPCGFAKAVVNTKSGINGPDVTNLFILVFSSSACFSAIPYRLTLQSTNPSLLNLRTALSASDIFFWIYDDVVTIRGHRSTSAEWLTINSPVYILSSTMLVKVNSIDIIKKKIKVTQLDIDDYGSVIPLKELELNVSGDDESVIQTLKNASYAAY
jgi:hypothetical protein